MPTNFDEVIMDLKDSLILQLQELKADLQVLQREYHKTATDIAVMKARAETYRTLAIVSIMLNAATVAALIYLITQR